jgi:phosphoglucomutase
MPYAPDKVPSGWRHFGTLLDGKRLALFGEVSDTVTTRSEFYGFG